ncbi:hypothetical protein GGR56DRAFT_72619 [Xylariaceae sp. FL0804]|nr:hypothetical protein GGR56DRAFT_72619 [Xylariaceae sp. FL0804]
MPTDINPKTEGFFSEATIWSLTKAARDVFVSKPTGHRHQETFTALYPTAKQCFEGDRKLEDTWESLDKSGTVFMALDIDMDDKKQELAAIGFSQWVATRGEESFTSYWEVEETSSPKTDSSFHDQAKRVRKSDVGQLLREIIGEDLANRYKEIILVGHDLRYKLDILEQFWKFPKNIRSLDTQLMGQEQHRLSELASQRWIMPGNSRPVEKPRDAGDRAQCAVDLLQGLITLKSNVEKN